MNTTVITTAEKDYGAGSTDRVTFADCQWHVDDTGCLHIIRSNRGGNVAAFGAGSWTTVVQAGIVVASEASR